MSKAIPAARRETSALSTILSLHPQTIRNQHSKGTFPIPGYIEGGKLYFDDRDIQAYLDARRAEAHARMQSKSVETIKTKDGRGRPTKAEQIEAARRGITVRELRAQSVMEV